MATCRDEEEDVVKMELLGEEEEKEEFEDEENTKQHSQEELDSMKELPVSGAEREDDVTVNEPDEKDYQIVTVKGDECHENEQEATGEWSA